MKTRVRQGWLALCWCALSIIGAWSTRDTVQLLAEAPLAPTSTDEGESSLDPAAARQLADFRTALNPLLVRDRRHRLLLSRGDSALNQGDPQEALPHLQALLDASEDAFFWCDGKMELRGACDEVVHRLQTLPPSHRAVYERMYGHQARELLCRYRESRDRRDLLELCRRFGQTDAAREAMVLELLLARDTGRRPLAAEWAQRLQSSLPAGKQLSPLEHALVASQSTSGASIEHVDHQNLTTEGARASDASLDAVTPPFALPLWTRSFHADADRMNERPSDRDALADELLHTVVHEWMNGRSERRIPIASANEAVVIGEAVVVRDYSCIRALHRTTGRTLWTYRCAASLMSEAQQRVEQAGLRTSAGPLDFDAHFASNAILGRPVTDGVRVYALDRVAASPASAGGGTPSVSLTTNIPPPNQLVALAAVAQGGPQASDPRPPREIEPLWSRGFQSMHKDDELEEHVFLGPPLCIDDRLFILTESDLQVTLFALEAGSGRTLWRQAIAVASRPAVADGLRARTACAPLYAEGIIICPTEVGVVIGVDALTGTLRWASDHLDQEYWNNPYRWTAGAGKRNDRISVMGRGYVRRGNCVLLPQRSDTVECLNVKTGERQWRAPRGEAQMIAGVNDALVLLLGDRNCRALDLQSGRFLWETTIPEPAGGGLLSGDRFLLPTSAGPCITLQLTDGQIMNGRFSRLLYEVAQRQTQVPVPQHSEGSAGAGNAAHSDVASSKKGGGSLIAIGDVLISTTPTGIAAYMQARPALTGLRQSALQPFTPEQALKEAQLLIALGDLDAAGQRLDECIKLATDNVVRESGETLLQEIQLVELEHTLRPRPVLDRLWQLARTDQQRLRAALAQYTAAVRMRDAGLLLDTIERVQNSPPDVLLKLDEEGHSATARQWLWEQLRELRENGPADLQRIVMEYAATRGEQLMDCPSPEPLESYLSLFAGWSAAAPVHARLAEAWIAKEDAQCAELLLLSDRFETPPVTGDRRAALLSGIYSRTGVGKPFRPSETLVRQRPALTAQYTSGVSWSEATLQARPASLLKDADRHGSRTAPAASHPERRAEIIEWAWGGDASPDNTDSQARLRDLHQSANRRLIPRPTGNMLVLDGGPMHPEKARSRLTIADRDRGLIHGEVTLPVAYWHVPAPLREASGHVMVVGGETAFGVSLLEAKLLWSLPAEHVGSKSEKLKVGPVGADYCVLQSPRELRVVHPATGHTLWSRDHLPAGVGLLGDEATGILGDSRTLTIFDADGTSYTVYSTQSGIRLKRGTREIDPESTRRQRWAVGRRLVELLVGEQGSRLQVWDSFDDRIEFDISLLNRLVAPLENGIEFACLTSSGRLRILNVEDGSLKLDVPLLLQTSDSSAETLKDVKNLVAFSDRDRWFINLFRESTGSEYVAATDNAAFPCVRLCGRVLAFDREHGTLLWDEVIGDACVPVRPGQALPVLVLMRRSRDGLTQRARTGDDTQRLMIDVLDTTTGEVLATRHQLTVDQFFECSVAALPSAEDVVPTEQVRLLGANVCIDIACSRGEARGVVRAAGSALTVDR